VEPPRHRQVQLACKNIPGASGQHRQGRLRSDQAIHHLSNGPITAGHKHDIAAVGSRLPCIGGGIARSTGLFKGEHFPASAGQQFCRLPHFIEVGLLAGRRVVDDGRFQDAASVGNANVANNCSAAAVGSISRCAMAATVRLN
jgi:hypothetical protein